MVIIQAEFYGNLAKSEKIRDEREKVRREKTSYSPEYKKMSQQLKWCQKRLKALISLMLIIKVF